METSKITQPSVSHGHTSNFLQIIENEQGEKINLEEVIVFAPFTEYGSVRDQVIHLNDEKTRGALKMIDQKQLIMLVKDRETIWNFDLPKKSQACLNRVWLEIKRAFNNEFTIAYLKSEWKSIMNRFLKIDQSRPVKARKLDSSRTIKVQDLSDNELIKSMSFLGGNRLSRGKKKTTYPQFHERNYESDQSNENIAIYTKEYDNKDAFNETDERKLVQLVRDQGPIYNSRLISDRKKSWLKIKREFNHKFTLSVLKLHWKRVRDRYKKRKKILAEDGVKDEFMKSMSFLDYNGIETNQEYLKDQETEATSTETFPQQPSHTIQRSQINDNSIDEEAAFKDGNKKKLDETKLINLVRNNESIWNEELKKDFKNYARRKLAWTEIERDFNYEFIIDDIKGVWKRARNRYKKRKQNLGENGEDEFMMSMSFLDTNQAYLMDQGTEGSSTAFLEQPHHVTQTSQINDHSIDEKAKFKDENKKKLWMNISEIDETKLINLVCNNQSIWNGESKKDVKNNARRKLAWSEIEQDFNYEFTVDELRRAWKRVRDRYLKRKKVIGEGGVEDEFMKSMSFLKNNDMEKKHEVQVNQDTEATHIHQPNENNDNSKVVDASLSNIDNKEEFIDKMKLVQLVRNKQAIWNEELKPEDRNQAHCTFAWSEIERDFNFEFTRKELKRTWERLIVQYLKCQKRIKREKLGHSSKVVIDENELDQELIEAMSFVNEVETPPTAMNKKYCSKKKLKPIEPINQIFLPEANPIEFDIADNFPFNIKFESEDNLNLSADIEMNSGNCVADIKIEDQETACRACLQEYATEESQKFFLNRTKIDGEQLVALYNEYIGYTNPNSESLLPASICIDCRNALLAFHEFRKKCRSNETTFMEAVRISEENIKPNTGEGKDDIEEMVDHGYSAPSDFYLDLNTNNLMVFEEKDEVRVADKSTVEQERPSISTTFPAVEQQTNEIKKSARHKCGKCGKTYSKPQGLWGHLKYVHKLSIAAVTKIKAELVKKETHRTPKTLEPMSVCQICGKSVRMLARHLQTHNEETRVQCTLCHRTYKAEDYLNDHMKAAHQGGIKYNCQYCPKTFTTWGGHRIHTHLKHYKVKSNLQCEICKKCFPSTFTLRRHRTWHNKKKSFECDVCNHTFTNSTGLKYHKEEQHQNEKWPCEACGITCKSKRQLQQHIEKHLGERNYECPVCSSVFAQNVVLRLHVEKIHPGHVLPPKGTVVSKKALEQKAMQRQIEEQYVKIDFEEMNIE